MGNQRPDSESKAVAYLDLLGFSELVRRNLREATSLIENYNDVLAATVCHERPSDKGTPSSGKPAPERLRRLLYFLPMSDSVFAVSVEPGTLVEFLVGFLADTYLYTAQAYSQPEGHDDPTRVTVSEASSTGIGQRGEKWPPTLFRGGLAYGKVLVLRQLAIREGADEPCYNLAGAAVIEAIQLEKKKKGPLVLCSQHFAYEVPGPIRRYISNMEHGFHEILWPMSRLEGSNGGVDPLQFRTFFGSAANLYKAFAKHNYSSHYAEFLRLVVRSAVTLGVYASSKAAVTRHIEQAAREHGVLFLVKDLIRDGTKTGSA